MPLGVHNDICHRILCIWLCHGNNVVDRFDALSPF